MIDRAERIRRAVRAWVVAPLAIIVVASALSVPAAAEPVPGSQGTDTSLPLTESAVTVAGRGDFADLQITVNQTRDLTNQAISITWQGGRQTTQGPGRFASNYLQMFQCWGDDDGTVPGNPGPPPEHCVAGAVSGTFGGVPGEAYPNGFATTRVISRTSWTNYDEDDGVLDSETGNVWRAFRSVDGTEIGVHTDPDFNPSIEGGRFWQNPYFDIVTTNEIAGAVTFADGSGAEIMQVLTGVQSSGLGCGQRVLTGESGEPEVPRCWIVVVPRGDPATENAGSGFEAAAAQNGVSTSPLSSSSWQNRIAIPLEFSPVDSPCALGQDERRISGNELAFAAVASWQPVLCGGGELPPFSYAPVGDPTARQQLVTPASGAPGLIAVSRPLDASERSADDPVVYAPLVASGVVVAFNIERVTRPTAPEGARALSGVRVADINLTPRLVAKLLTQSYVGATRIIVPNDYSWNDDNADDLGNDPDFLRFNPEFELLRNSGRNFSALTVSAGNSDTAELVWEWILADAEATAWLAGEPDEWGMRVNPVYSTDPEVNPSGRSFAEPVPSSFPKADPYCYQSPPIGPTGNITPPVLCGIDWLPYTRSFDESAAVTRAASDGARVVLNPFALSSADVWKREEPQFLGSRTIISLTDSASASRYGLQTASLSRAGDNGPDRAFVRPDAAGVSAGLASMVAGDEPTVLEPQVTGQPPGAYPLSTLTYGAIAPLRLDADARSDYADFIRYAVGPGQTLGTGLGSLPFGYIPLPDGLRTQAEESADLVVSLEAPPQPEEPRTPTTTAPPTSIGSIPTSTPTSSPPILDGPPPVPFDPAPVPVNDVPFPDTGGPGPDPLPPAPAVEAQGPTVPPLEEEASVTTTASEATTTTIEGSVEEEPSGPTGTTPDSDMPPTRFAVPIVGGMAMASALMALEITKRPRRSLGDLPDDSTEPED